MKALLTCFTLLIALCGLCYMGQTSLAHELDAIWTVEDSNDPNNPNDPNEPDEPPCEYVWTVAGEPDPNIPEEPDEEPLGKE